MANQEDSFSTPPGGNSSSGANVQKVTEKLQGAKIAPQPSRKELPVSKWNAAQLKRHRKEVRGYVYAGETLPPELKKLEEDVQKWIESKSSETLVDDNGGEPSGSGNESLRSNVGKRKLTSEGSTPSKPQGKKSRGEEDPQIASTADPPELAAFLVNGNPVVPMTDIQIKLVKEAMHRKIAAISQQERRESDPVPRTPRFIRRSEESGVFHVVAADQFTLDWLIRFTTTCGSLWRGIKLRVVDEADLPKVYTMEAMFRYPVSIQDLILQELNVSNPEMGCTSWTIIARTVNKKNGSVYHLFRIPQQSWETLRENQFHIYYGAERYTLRERAVGSQSSK